MAILRKNLAQDGWERRCPACFREQTKCLLSQQRQEPKSRQGPQVDLDGLV